MKTNNVTLAIILAFFTVLVLGVVGLEVAGRSPNSIIYLAVAVLVPAIPSFIGLKATNDVAKTQEDVKAELAQVNNDLALVRQQTNGTTTSLVRVIADAGLAHQLPDAPAATTDHTTLFEDDGPRHAK